MSDRLMMPVRSSAVIPQSPALSVAARRPSSGGQWLVSPWFDLLFLANIGWPLVLLWQFGEGFQGREGLLFWQVYFVTTPHRWITLAVVFLDRPRFQQRRGTFLGILLIVVIVCLGVRFTTGTLTCLLTIDYLWNAWHFAAQHHGVYRIYGRLAEPERAQGLGLEKWGMRLFLLYVSFRVAGTTWKNAELETWLRSCDWAVLLLPAGLMIRDARQRTGQAWGRWAYLLSVTCLYVSLLAAVHAQRPALVLSLTTASALFHAVEYLSLIGWSVRKRHHDAGDQLGLLGWLAPRWGIALTVYVVILGSGGWLMDHHLYETWLLINVMVAFLHYTYDGLIWKGPRKRNLSPATG